MLACTGALRISARPSGRKPVPRSKITVASPQTASTHEVLPPVFRVPLPGDAPLPRPPQKPTVMDGFFFCPRRPPATPQQCRKTDLAARLCRVLLELDQVAGLL